MARKQVATRGSFEGLQPLESRRLLSTVALDFSGNAGGIANTGFTGAFATTNGKGLAAGKLAIANGLLSVTSTAGDLVGTSNDQDNALDVALDGSRSFTVQTRLTGLPFTKDYQSGGLFIGTNEDNYLKLVVGHGGGQVVQFASEINGAFTTVALPTINFTGVQTLDLRLVGDPATHAVTAQYRINSDSDSAWVTVGSVTNTAAVNAASKAGILTTNYGAKASVVVPFDSFSETVQDATGAVTPGANIDATKQSGNEMESQIAVNPTNPNNIVLVAQNDVNNGASVTVSRSTDGGATWTVTSLGGKQDGYAVATQRPDARVAFDGFGNLYVVYMVGDPTHAIHLVAFRSADGGATFTFMGSIAGGADGVSPDDPAIATGVSAANANQQAIWISFTDYGTGRIRVIGATATKLGKVGAFSAAKTVSDAFGAYASVAVGPYGQLAVAWQSDDEGQGPNQVMLDVDATGTGNSFGVDKDVTTTNVGGYDFIPAQPDRSIDAEVKVAFDTSTGANRGRLYLAYTDEPVDESNDTDIFLRYSDNLGASFTSATRVNDDATHNSQFLPTLAVDPTTGNVALTWYDARNSADNTGAQLYAAVSFDHGRTFNANVQISAGLSNQAYANPSPNDLDYGDNGGIAFFGGKLIAVWSDNSNSTGNNPNGNHSKFDTLVDVITVTQA